MPHRLPTLVINKHMKLNYIAPETTVLDVQASHIICNSETPLVLWAIMSETPAEVQWGRSNYGDSAITDTWQ